MYYYNAFYRSLLESESPVIAIVPGSFKPPHAGHYDMVKRYSDIADKVYIIISSPKNAVRKTSTGKTITPQVSKQIWELYIKDGHLNNTEILISDTASPVSSAYILIEELFKSYNNPFKVILGASQKGNDYMRWANAKRFINEISPDIELLDTKKYAVPAFKDISASDIRNNIEDESFIKTVLPQCLKDSSIKKILSLLQ